MTQLVDTGSAGASLPDVLIEGYVAVSVARTGRLLTITINRPDKMNAVNLTVHEELARVLAFAADDAGSDVVLLTGAGRAFSVGGDLDHISGLAAEPERFEHERRIAKRIIFSLLEIEKPLICKMNGHAVGLGATIALFCDVIFAAEHAKIGDPHAGLGLVAGDGGAAIWAQRSGSGRAKEFLLTGDLLTAPRATAIGLINHCLPQEELDSAVAAFCDRLLNGATQAIRWTKTLTNLELKRVAHAVIDAGLAYEALSIRTQHHREGVEALIEGRKPQFTSKGA